MVISSGHMLDFMETEEFKKRAKEIEAKYVYPSGELKMTDESKEKPQLFEDDCVDWMKMFLLKKGIPNDILDSLPHSLILHNFRVYVREMKWHETGFPTGLLFK